MQTAEIITLERSGNDAVKRLRETELAKGLPFMINAQGLPDNQCYLEYPDGNILLVTITASTDRDFTVIRQLSCAEKDDILRNFLLR